MHDVYYKNIVSFIGSQNPNSKYWFVGTEENWDLDNFLDFSKKDLGEQIEKLKKEFSKLNDLNGESYEFSEEDFEDFYKCKPRSYYSGIKSILELIFKTEDKQTLKKIILGDLNKNNSEIFISNLASIGKNRNSKLSPECIVNNVFEIEINKYKYDELSRLEKLNKVWEKFKPDFTFIFIGSRDIELSSNIRHMFNYNYYDNIVKKNYPFKFPFKVKEKSTNLFSYIIQVLH